MKKRKSELIEVKVKKREQNEIPIMALRSTVVFPNAVVPLTVARAKSVRLIDDVVAADKLFGVLAQKDESIDDPSPNNLYEYGTICKVMRMLKSPDETIMLMVQGIDRFKVLQFMAEEPYLVAKIEKLESIIEEDKELLAISEQVKRQFQRMLSLAPFLQPHLQITVMNLDPDQLADFVTANLDVKVEERQKVLETLNVKERLKLVLKLLSERIELLELGSKIQSQVKDELERGLRERLLREQMAAIKRELGEAENPELKELEEKIKQAKMPKEAEAEAKRELERLAQIHPSSAEYTVARTYLDWLLALPWEVATQDNLDIKRARETLDGDHYDLERVKERILEFLAVRKLKQDMKGPILCFVGPPGVGKTSLGMSIARALGRKFVRISLGGVGDEAEIRGHRRTYVGALPGRIIQGIRKAGSNNPVFMLDEVDKLGRDFRGDPAAALLEVLDPEQNSKFQDHYLDVPFDLSKVMFITTANILDTIPAPLLDRLEILELPGYSEEEKLMIAKRYLIPKQLAAHGLDEQQLVFAPQAIKKIIREYTREAGVRNLERELAAVCRKAAVSFVEGGVKAKQVVEEDVPHFLGPPKVFFETAERTARSGVAIGLAWTPTGGDIIFIEATKMQGKGNLILTGQLGGVMKESAQAALSFIRSKARDFGIDPEVFANLDFHIHIPQGAIPKDGPSAGVTIVTALVSLLTDIPVRPDLTMTGEITLRGKVLPVGGIREKVLAAHRAGIHKLILPKRNEKDLMEVAKNVKEDMEFHFIEEIDEAIKEAIPKCS